MASTSQTAFYGLPQYIGTDRASWLDTNEPFEAVDTALHSAVTGVEQATAAVETLSADVAQAQLDITSLDGRMDTAEDNISNLQSTVAGHTADIADVRRDLQDNIESSREDNAVSTHAYAIGDYFYYNDILFKATAVIAIGDTIVPNTNCTGVTVMDEMLNMAPTPGTVTAEDVTFDNTSSGLTADDVQGAIDELKASINNLHSVSVGTMAVTTAAVGDYETNLLAANKAILSAWAEGDTAQGVSYTIVPYIYDGKWHFSCRQTSTWATLSAGVSLTVKYAYIDIA